MVNCSELQIPAEILGGGGERREDGSIAGELQIYTISKRRLG